MSGTTKAVHQPRLPAVRAAVRRTPVTWRVGVPARSQLVMLTNAIGPSGEEDPVTAAIRRAPRDMRDRLPKWLHRLEDSRTR